MSKGYTEDLIFKHQMMLLQYSHIIYDDLTRLILHVYAVNLLTPNPTTTKLQTDINLLKHLLAEMETHLTSQADDAK